MKEWINCGDVNFLTYGGNIIRKRELEDEYEVLNLICPFDTDGETWIFDRAVIFLSDFEKEKEEIGRFAGTTYDDENYNFNFVCDIVSYYGIGNLNSAPYDFKETTNENEIREVFKKYGIEFDEEGYII